MSVTMLTIDQDFGDERRRQSERADGQRAQSTSGRTSPVHVGKDFTRPDFCPCYEFKI
jgi:hypothetical protein